MARVVSSKAIKQASLNLSDMVDKRRLDFTLADVTEAIKDVEVIRSASPSFTWDKEDKKPYVIEGVLEQIKTFFDVGTEVENFSVKYYAPPTKNAQNKPSTHELRIDPIKNGLGGRFVVVVGTKEVPTLEIAMGSSGAENQYSLFDGDCMYLKLTVCPVLNIVFSNNFSERLPPRKGHREMIIKKNLFNRHVFVIDAHVSMGAVASKVKDELIGLSSEEAVAKAFGGQSDVVAEMAKEKE